MTHYLGARPDTRDARDYRYHARRAAAKAASGERQLPVSIDNRDECTAVRRQRHNDCVGQSIAGIAEFLYWRQLGREPAFSPWAAYVLAQRHDEWPGEEPVYEGTSIRGGLKAWAASGMYPANVWPYEAPEPVMEGADAMARKFPLRRYERVVGLWEAKHSIHAAGAVLMTAMVTAGWDTADAGVIVPSMVERGYHAFMAPGYDDRRDAFLIKNSWGLDWGIEGYAWLPYADFERNVTDVWLPAIRNGGWLSRILGLLRQV